MSADKLKKEMQADLKSWGIGLIIIGIISNIFRDFFDPTWGVIVILLGVLTIAIMERRMYVVIGSSLIAIGTVNMVWGVLGNWTFFGLIQIIIGVKELYKFKKYSSVK